MHNSTPRGIHNAHTLAHRHKSSSSSVTMSQNITQNTHDSQSNGIYPLKCLSNTLTHSHTHKHTFLYTQCMFSVWHHAEGISTFVLFNDYFYREPLPTVFSMLHPLDEIAPAVCKPTGTEHRSAPHLISHCPLPPCVCCIHTLTPPCAFPGPFPRHSRAVRI